MPTKKNNLLRAIIKSLFAIAFGSMIFIFTGCEKDDEQFFENSGLCLVFLDGTFQDVELDQMPVFLDGGEDGFLEKFQEVLRYPPQAREAGIQGLCVVQFEITEHGEVENLVAIEDPGGGIGTSTVEALSTIIQGVAYSPGIFELMPVRVRKEMRVRFKLQ